MDEQNWFEYGVAAVIAALGWLFKRHVARVDELERTSVRKKDFDDFVDSSREQVSELRAHMDAKFDAQTQRIFEMLRDRR